MLYKFLIAFIIGLVISFPAGAAGQLMINRSLKYGLFSGLAIGLITAFLDAVYCGLALAGISFINNYIHLKIILQAIGFGVLLYIGYKDIFTLNINSHADVNLSPMSNKSSFISSLKYFPFLLLATFGNPTLFAFWLNMSYLIRDTILKSESFREFILFSLFLGAGSFFTQLIVLKTINSTKFFQNTGSKKMIRIASGILFIIALFYLGYNLVKTFLINYMHLVV